MHGQSSHFVWINRDKEFSTVDLTDGEDLVLVLEMLSKVDVFVQNLLPGATDRLGIGSERLRALFPKLIVGDIGGLAPGTLNHERKAYDLLVQAEAGLTNITGSPRSSPSRLGISICVIATGQAGYGAISRGMIEGIAGGHQTAWPRSQTAVRPPH